MGGSSGLVVREADWTTPELWCKNCWLGDFYPDEDLCEGTVKSGKFWSVKIFYDENLCIVTKERVDYTVQY